MANQENVTVTGYSTGVPPVDLKEYAGYAVLALIGVLIVVVAALQGRQK